MSRLRVLPIIGLAGLIALGGAIPVSARRAPDAATVRSFTTPAEDRFYAECTDADDTECIVSAEVRAPGESSFSPADESLTVVVAPGENWLVTVAPQGRSGAFELAPEFPVGTTFRLVVNSGAVTPRTHMWAFARDVAWTRSQAEDTDWIQTFEFTSASRTEGGTACGGCPTTDYQSVAYLQIADLDAVKAEPELSAFTGAIVAGNSNLAPTNIDGDSQTISWWGYGPSNTASGDPHIGWIEAFLPDALLQLFFGLDAQGVIDSNGVTVRAGSADGDPVTSTMTVVPGGLRITVEGFRVLDQDAQRSTTAQRVQGGQFVLRGKRMAEAPRSVAVKGGKRRAVVTADPVRKARGYQALCFQKSKRVYRSADTPRIVVRTLAPGRWRCQIRAMKATGGYWSRTVRTTVQSSG